MDEALEIIRDKSALVLSGGGTLGIGEIGSLRRLDDFGLKLKKFKSVSGSSVGSLIATAIACGGTMDYIENKMEAINYQLLADKDCILVQAGRLLKNFGIRDMDGVRKLVSEVLIDLVGTDAITFQQLFNRTGVWLTITYLSFNYERTIFADHIYEPDSLIRESVVKSAAIPIFYESYQIGNGCNKEVIVDGGVMLNYPMMVPHLQGYKDRDILGLKFISSESKDIEDKGQPGKVEEFKQAPSNIIEYLTNLIGILRNQAMKVHVEENDWMNTVKINVGTLSSTDFNMSKQQKDWLYNQGMKAANEYILKLAELIDLGKYPL